jgi:predicted ATPase
MLGIHKQMHEAKRIEGIKGDVLPRVIEKTIQRGRLICFDEFQVTDVADALILRRLFTGLLERDAVIVATSNRPPRDLYLNGLQRDLFLPFIDLLEERTAVISMWQSETDYRLVQGENKARGVYFIGPESKSEFERVCRSLTKHSPIEPIHLSVQGRMVHVPQASMTYGVARFTFDDLCSQPKGAADYLLIGETFHTVFVEDVPILNENAINLVRRFIIFVDAMYESHVKLIIHAATLPQGIFKVDLANKVIDEVFAFDRTRSRLEEMSSDGYLQKKWQGKKSLSGHMLHADINTMDDRDVRQS